MQIKPAEQMFKTLRADINGLSTKLDANASKADLAGLSAQVNEKASKTGIDKLKVDIGTINKKLDILSKTRMTLRNFIKKKNSAPPTQLGHLWRAADVP